MRHNIRQPRFHEGSAAKLNGSLVTRETRRTVNVTDDTKPRRLVFDTV